MKKAEQIDQFIILRAQGKSLAAIASELNINKSTAFQWSKEQAAAIREAQQQRAAELVSLYHKEKEEHRQHLKAIMQKIDKALDSKDLDTIPAEKLLKLKLDCLDRLQAEPPEVIPALDFYKYDSSELLQALATITDGIQAGTMPPQQSRAALAALELIRKGMEYRSEHQLGDDFLNDFFRE